MDLDGLTGGPRQAFLEKGFVVGVGGNEDVADFAGLQQGTGAGAFAVGVGRRVAGGHAEAGLGEGVHAPGDGARSLGGPHHERGPEPCALPAAAGQDEPSATPHEDEGHGDGDHRREQRRAAVAGDHEGSRRGKQGVRQQPHVPADALGVDRAALGVEVGQAADEDEGDGRDGGSGHRAFGGEARGHDDDGVDGEDAKARGRRMNGLDGPVAARETARDRGLVFAGRERRQSAVTVREVRDKRRKAANRCSTHWNPTS